MTTYLAEHKRNIMSEKAFSKGNIPPGAIITFNYTNEEKKTSKPMVLVLNPVWEGHLHGIRIDLIPERTLQRLTDTIKLWYSRKVNEMLRLRLPLLKVNVGPPKMFYEQTLKGIIKRQLKLAEPYREYKINHMSGVKIIEYDFHLKARLDEEAARKKKHDQNMLAIQRRKLEESKVNK